MSENSMQSQSPIDSIVRQEEEALERRSSSERLADAIGVFAGSLLFVVLHLVLVVAWLLINSGKIPGARPFDPYPSRYSELLLRWRRSFSPASYSCVRTA
jgi:uncharacterized membrane protein